MVRNKIKIAIFHLAFVYSGGGERLVLEEAIRLEEKGYDVTCFVPIVDEKRCFPELLKKAKVRKLLPSLLPAWFPDLELFSILAACLFVPFFFYKFKKYDLYFGANQPGPWISYILAKINKKPYFIYLAQPTRLIHPRLIDQQVGMRITDGHSLLNILRIIFRPIIQWLDVISIRGAKKVFVNGSYATGMIEQVYGINAINCPAGAAVQQGKLPEKFSGDIQVNGFRIRKPYVLLTNRHFAQKKFEYAIEAVNLLDKRVPLVITGQETAYTRILKRRFGKRNGLFFVGLLSEEDLQRVYDHACVYVYPAPEEDFGMGIIEAMSYGVPVVAWGNAGPTGIISSGKDGILVRPFAVGELAKGIERIMGDRKLYKRLSLAGRKKVEELFSYEKHVTKIESVIRKL
jgi:glycosyltransferase involved in cell wall biosynthesis